MIKRHPAQETQEGAGVQVKRLMPIATMRNYDPFVLWDDFTITPGHGFPTHPHRGFEAITYLFSGSLNHADNLGNNSTVTGGGAQRFTAGRGLEHSEMPHEHAATRGIQFWINLPRRLKQIEPAYQQVNDGEFPVEEIEGGAVKVLVGDGSPLKILTPIRYLQIDLKADTQYSVVIPAEMRGFLYVADGEVTLNQERYSAGDSAFFEDEPSLQLIAITPCRLMFACGQPHGEPIVQSGPYVD
ncbi:MAG: Pirin domain-containing protein [Halothiobacillaceae bacterium]|nr:MAG: Pirin domain-containing protein [Halothiobacillaceae bacterium]